MHRWDLGEKRRGERERGGREGGRVGGGRYLKSITGLLAPGVLPVAISYGPLAKDTFRLLAKGCRKILSMLDIAFSPGREMSSDCAWGHPDTC